MRTTSIGLSQAVPIEAFKPIPNGKGNASFIWHPRAQLKATKSVKHQGSGALAARTAARTQIPSSRQRGGSLMPQLVGNSCSICGQRIGLLRTSFTRSSDGINRRGCSRHGRRAMLVSKRAFPPLLSSRVFISHRPGQPAVNSNPGYA
jgi:hypothetical protein